MHRKNYPAPETVNQRTVIFTSGGKTCFQQIVAPVTGTLCLSRKRIALLGAVTQLEFFDDIVPKSTLLEITQSYDLPFRIFVECFHKIIAGEFVQDKHTVAIALRLLLLVSQLFFNNFNIVFFGQEFQCFVIRKLLVLHYKMHGRAAFATSEAFANIFGRRHIKRRGPVVVKRA
ncbi:hypothetical protein SDC9_154353 [bioreactor metagenome]|uniref:Uncharacterized protein n=1 Tax=bioreactor metagenome TaxID=1076179 RepID=A0A645EYS6_9ZZZZ